MKYTSVIVWTYDYSLLGRRSLDLAYLFQAVLQTHLPVSCPMIEKNMGYASAKKLEWIMILDMKQKGIWCATLMCPSRVLHLELAINYIAVSGY